MKSRKIKVLILLENPNFGGINSAVINLFPEYLRSTKIEPILAIFAKNNNGYLFDLTHELGLPVFLIECNGPKDILVVKRLFDLIKGKNIDILHTHSYRGNIYSQVLYEFGLIKIPRITTKHGLPVCKNLRLKMYYWLDRRPTILSDKIIAVDNITKNRWMQWGVDKNKIQVIPNAIGPNYFEVSKSRNIRNIFGIGINDIVCLYHGRIEKSKGINELVNAHRVLVEQLDNKLWTIILGDGNYKEFIERSKINDSKLDQLILVDSTINVIDYLISSDIVILPSYSEGFPMSILEGMALGKPIIATNVGGIPGMVIDGITGKLIQPNNVDQIIWAVKTLSDPLQRKIMGDAGKRRVLENYSSREIFKRIEELYVNIINMKQNF